MEGISFVDKYVDETGEGWVTVRLTKSALDYIREGITIKADAMERETVTDDTRVPMFNFARQLQDEINTLRGYFD